MVLRRSVPIDRALVLLLGLAAQDFCDHPDGAVLIGGLAGEEPALRLAVIGVIGSLVLGIEVTPVAGAVAIQQADDHLVPAFLKLKGLLFRMR